MNYPFVKHPIFKFIVKFLLLCLFFYYSAEVYIGITSPGNVYFHFLDKYFNFFDWYRVLLLWGAHLMTEMVGYHSFIKDKLHLQIKNGHSVQLVFTCLGYALLSVWFSFVIAYPSKIKKKIYWIIIGFLSITFLNMIRLASLVIVANKVNLNFVDHHTYFNVSVYICIIIMIYFFTKEKTKPELSE